MAYKALYNKYRPMSFEEVCGQQAIVQTLRNSILKGKIANAYLFCGPRGTGKTSMARLFAKALNCEEGLGKQCNQCSNCLALNNGAHPDVIEIDAASNSGVEEIRNLIEKVRYSPIKGKYKIYIIDEVHMMSNSAFNALLKTLEEPPEHVVFILATTESHKILPTIVSRCQRYDFGKINQNEIEQRIIKILSLEDVSYEEGAVSLLAELADGGLRDALSLLDQALAYGGNKLLEKDVLSVFGLTSIKEKADLLDLIIEGDMPAIIQKLDAYSSSGTDIKRLSQSLLDILKELLIFKRTKEPLLLKTLKSDLANHFVDLMNTEQINRSIDILLKAIIDFKAVTNVRSLFELSLLEMTSLFNIEESKTVEPKKETPVQTKQVEVVSEEPQIEPVKEEPSVETVEEIAPEEPKQEDTYNPDSGQKYEGDTVPSFLLEGTEEHKTEEKPQTQEVKIEEKVEVQKEEIKPIDTASFEKKDIEVEGERYVLDDDTIVKIMVKGRKYKSDRQELRNQWSRLESLKLDEDFGRTASLLCEGKPFCLCGEALLVNFSFARHRDQANIKNNQKQIAQLVSSLIGRTVFVYGLDRNDSNRTQNHYYSLDQLNKLPKPDEFELDLPKGGN